MLTNAPVNVATMLAISVILIAPLLGAWSCGAATQCGTFVALFLGNVSAVASYAIWILPKYALITGGKPNAWQATGAPYEPSVFNEWRAVVRCRFYLIFWCCSNIFLAMLFSSHRIASQPLLSGVNVEKHHDDDFLRVNLGLEL